MDELEALNMLLRAIGSAPVNDVSSPYPSAANARATLKRASRKGQMRGWWFNTDHSVLLARNESGMIDVPESYLNVLTSDPAIVHRGARMYDSVNNTYTFACDVVATRVVRLLDWDDLHPSAQELFAYSAAREYVRDELGDRDKENSFKQDAEVANVELNRVELKMGQYNIFDQPRVRQARMGVQPYNRGGSRFFGKPSY